MTLKIQIYENIKKTFKYSYIQVNVIKKWVYLYRYKQEAIIRIGDLIIHI